jgi:tRNA 2-selenouridine synthase
MTWRELSVEQLYSLRTPLLVDVRSPCEHSSEYIPGSINVPLLTDGERAVVGTVYAEEGENNARRLALGVISPKIPMIVDDILSRKQPGQTIVVHCWRGGLRSEAVASFLAIIGVDCWRLTGGYKTWRRYVLDQFTADSYGFAPIVLHGQTGVGKSDILTALASIGEQVLDLELLANHRGSAFGSLGLGAQPTQKNFEANLWMELRRFEHGPVFLEAESRKVGKLSLPDFLFKRIENGRRVLVTGSIASRVERIHRQYLGADVDSAGHRLSDGIAQLESLRQRISASRLTELQELLAAGQLPDAIQVILSHYYDPLYDKQIKQCEPFELIVDGDDPATAASSIREWSRNLLVSSN